MTDLKVTKPALLLCARILLDVINPDEPACTFVYIRNRFSDFPTF